MIEENYPGREEMNTLSEENYSSHKEMNMASKENYSATKENNSATDAVSVVTDAMAVRRGAENAAHTLKNRLRI